VTVDHDDRDGGALIALTPSEVQALTRALSHEAFPEFGDGRVVRTFVRSLMHVRAKNCEGAPTTDV
jgi:uncharacterized protein YehS (DUF1456 family)